MKRTISYAIIFLMYFTVPGVQTYAQSKDLKDIAAIQKVIELETSTYFHKDYEDWAATWAKDSADALLRVGPLGCYHLLGWNAIAAKYKAEMQNMPPMTEAEIAAVVHKTDYDIKISGNLASASFKNGKQHNEELRILVKQDGSWKILSITSINSAAYALRQTINNMKEFAGKWELDGQATMEPSNGSVLNALRFDFKVTSTGMEQLSTFSVTTDNGQSLAPPAEHEYFIPDYSTNTVLYTDVYTNPSGQTYTRTGKVTSDHPHSFTVTVMYPDKPDAIQSEYTVTMEKGKWHQVNKRFDRDGKQTRTLTANLHRVMP